MANEEHVKQLRAGVSAWNKWRASTYVPSPDLSGVDLQRMSLSRINLDGAVLTRANLSEAYLTNATLIAANMEYADLSRAHLEHSNLWSANLANANLKNAHLAFANIHSVHMRGTNVTGALFAETAFIDLNLSEVIGLEDCYYDSRSAVDYRTLSRSGSLPLSFLQGVGLSDSFIEYLPSLLNQPIQHYSYFISYSAKDETFARRLHADLQGKGVRCWFAPHDLRIGDKILDTIDFAIRLRDKVLLILSQHSIRSDWVEDEVTKAFEEERKRGQIVLFPVRLDDAVMETKEAWAGKLRARHIGDFTRWKEHDEYQKSFARVLRDLTVKKDS
jgi:uncharacterized protein YjbI with pentapeptide repeats